MTIWKKLGATAIIGPLTGLSFYGAWKQGKKYKLSKQRWAKIDNLMENFNPQKIFPDSM